jgi:hypothetical protein
VACGYRVESRLSRVLFVPGGERCVRIAASMAASSGLGVVVAVGLGGVAILFAIEGMLYE